MFFTRNRTDLAHAAVPVPGATLRRRAYSSARPPAFVLGGIWTFLPGTSQFGFLPYWNVNDSGIPQTSHARTNAAVAAASAERHGATRRMASRTARSSGGSDATSAENRTLPPTGL